MARVFIGLGGNTGDRLAHLCRAVGLLGDVGQIEALSPLYETEPVGFAAQPWFLNGACEIRTGLAPLDLLAALKKIEQLMGRRLSFPNAPRPIDADILLYDDLVIETDALTVPHPRMHLRRFVLEPLAAIAAGVVHPVFKRTVADLQEELRDTVVVRLFLTADEWRGNC